MTHPFEKANLGQAPFSLVGIFESSRNVNEGSLLAEAIHIATGTCEYCLRSIKYCHQIQDANGKKFTVGSACCRKVDKQLEREFYSKRDAENDAKRIAEFRAEHKDTLEAFDKIFGTEKFEAKLFSTPHPFPQHVDKNLLDYINYVGISSDRDKVRYIQSDDLLSLGETTKKELALYRKHVRAIKKAEKIKKVFLENSQYVGEVGVRQEFTATIVDSFSFEGQWGYTTVTTLRDENNNCIKYWNSINSNDYITEGDVVTFKATVKQHMVSNRDDETYGQQQTVISRASKAKLVKEGK